MRQIMNKPTYNISPSSINLMLECPRCFRFRFNKGIKRSPRIFPSLPSGMDGILKKHFDNLMEKGELTPEEIKIVEGFNKGK